MGFRNPITGAIGQLVQQAIRSVNYIAGISGWIIRRDGTAEFVALTVQGILAQNINVTGASLAPTFPTYTGYIALDLPGSRQFQFLYDTVTGDVQIYVLSVGVNFSQGPTFETTPITLLNGMRPIYYSKPGLPDLQTKTVTIGPSVGANPLAIASSASITLDGATVIKLTLQCSRLDTTIGGDVFIFSFRTDGVTFDTVRYAATGGIDGGRTFAVITPAAPAAGAHTFDVIVTRIGGTGTISVACSATALAQLMTQEYL